MKYYKRSPTAFFFILDENGLHTIQLGQRSDMFDDALSALLRQLQ
jgi:hypothetical protein